MASLAHCVDLHKTSFPKEEMVALRSESRKLAMEKKIKPKEAMIQVARSRIAETQVEYNKIAGVVKEHYKIPEK
ncbi:MAG: hypothetical protein IMF20_02350, partial [Proteobacteria bacterium]|nr:hypothetical protein [Pseudomonadota bacterium]